MLWSAVLAKRAAPRRPDEQCQCPTNEPRPAQNRTRVPINQHSPPPLFPDTITAALVSNPANCRPARRRSPPRVPAWSMALPTFTRADGSMRPQLPQGTFRFLFVAGSNHAERLLVFLAFAYRDISRTGA